MAMFYRLLTEHLFELPSDDESSSSTTISAYMVGALGLAYYVIRGIVNTFGRHRYTKGGKYQRNWPFAPGWLFGPGHVHVVMSRGPNYLIDKIETLARRTNVPPDVGCFEAYAFGQRVMVITSEERAVEVLKHRPHAVSRGPGVTEALNSLGAKGIFSAEGSQWTQEHKLVSAALNKKNVGDYMTVMKEVTGRLTDKWTATCENTDTGTTTTSARVVVDADVVNFTADTVTKAIMGRDLDFLRHPHSRIAKDMMKVTGLSVVRGASPVWYWRIPVIGQYLDGFGFSQRRLIRVIDDAIEEEEARQESNTENVGNGNFVQKLLEISKAENSKLERERFVGNVFSLFLAGTHTTSGTLLNVLYMLANDQELQATLRTEIDTLDLTQATLEDLYTKLPRLKSFLHESHRHRGIPIQFSMTQADIPFCSTTLAKGTVICTLNHYIGTNNAKEVPLGPAGETLSEFCPTRYLVEAPDGTLTCPNPPSKGMAMSAFGYGVRRCPGRMYSEVFSYYAIASILQKFELALAPDHPTPNIVYDLLLVPDCKIELSLTLR